jgi:CRP/FNR family cyclic AMP-dependent transcriptional regulator
MVSAALECAEAYHPIGTRRKAEGIRSVDSQTPPITRFLARCRRRTYPAGAIAIRAGEVGDELYFLLSGSVAVLIEDVAGHEFVLAYLYGGDFFGEMGLFEEGHRRSAWVRTRSRCEVARMSYERWLGLTLECPEMMHAMFAQLARRLLEANRKVSELAFTDVAGRVARALLELCRQPDAMAHADGTQIRTTRQELSRIVGCSRETVGRVLKRLNQQGLIEVHGRTIVVHTVP